MALALRFAALIVLAIAAAAPAGAAESGAFAVVNGHRIYYEVRGEGRPLLLLHGGGATIATTFGHQIDAFAATHRVIAIEQVGHGHSPAVEGSLSYAAMTEDTFGVLDALGVRGADVVGLSDGAIIALMLAARHPDCVRRVVAAGANFAPDGYRARDLAGLRKTDPETMFSAADRAAILRLAPEGRARLASLGRQLKDLWLNRPTPDELSLAILARVERPALVVSGDHDVIREAHTLQLLQALPDSALWFVPGSGHDVFNEKPALVQRVVLGWLAQP
ncbi:MAG TPA: alpha/beta hydrolase [Burkholderiaceae bacterium]|nr:alpha/beta hydrolase [Burkholderiaceae bacterium]